MNVPSDSEEEKSLEELLGELNALIGLEKVKAKVSDLIAYQRVQKLRESAGAAFSKEHITFGVYR